MANVGDTLKNIGRSISNAVTDVLANSDFISRTIGMNNSYEDIMFIVQALGREPVSLLGKDYAFIYDHVRRNYMQGMDVPSKTFDFCNKFTFYKEVPTIRFANPYDDPMNLLSRWVPDIKTLETLSYDTELHYSESDDGRTNNRSFQNYSDLEMGGLGTAHNGIKSYQPNLPYCDMIGKTNSNFNHGKYQTLIARFHTNSEETKRGYDTTQTAFSKNFGLSHGRNLLSKNDVLPRINDYDNPYCRVWTYYHQYNQIKRQIRPFGNVQSEETLERQERVGNYDKEYSKKGVGFRTLDSKTDSAILGGSKALDKYGVLNYQNGTVNIAPTAKLVDYFENKEGNDIIRTKKCMFSLENLAWKNSKVKNNEFDAYGLSPEQKGPLGGRIMWFPPYNLKFNESVNVKWNSNEFIGRGENVYTYTNTERRGNLSFTLLIDHPSILDYWTGLERNGMSNRGTPLSEGNSGGVDNKDNQENTLLRFFAGCDILSAKPQEYRISKNEEKKEEKPKNDPIDKVPDTENFKKVTKKICAILYYPNNYSGKNDRNGIVNPIYYLMNGVGTQKHIDSNTLEAVDFGVDMFNKPQGSGDIYSGYETEESSKGISQVENPLEPNKDIIEQTYADPNNTKGDAPQYLTDENGIKLSVTYGNSEETHDLAKIIGSKALPLSQATDKNLNGKAHKWYRRRYYYRCDEEYENQKFSNPMSYIDAESYGLNGKSYDIRNTSNESIKEACNAFGIEQDSSEYKFISFIDLFVALEGSNVAVNGLANNANVEYVNNFLENKKKGTYSSIKIEFKGHASYQGYKSTNNDLATNRGLTIKNWLSSFNSLNGIQMGEVKIINQPKATKKDVGHVDDKEVKIWRSASITIEYEEDVVENAPMAEKVDGNRERTTIKDKENSQNNLTNAYDWLTNNPDGIKLMQAHPELRKRAYALTVDEIKKIASGASINESDVTAKGSEYIGEDYVQSTVKRYDNEGEFFQVLGENEPFLHHLVSEKIKYFDPAFHSISPEGFNARLTFLHQCTRQGSTVGNADGSVGGTAYNLAFGRPPICVLRIGDFYNTKILINGMQINYDQPQWDMNPEGIGMMPMFAEITLDFVFLGGSDLAGPIARLQNAVSFNYYANASVYDNRAERVVYDSNGSGREIAFKGFSYPNEYSGDKLQLSDIKKLEDI